MKPVPWIKSIAAVAYAEGKEGRDPKSPAEIFNFSTFWELVSCIIKPSSLHGYFYWLFAFMYKSKLVDKPLDRDVTRQPIIVYRTFTNLVPRHRYFQMLRGVTTAGDTGDASPVRPTMSPLHQNDNRQFIFGTDFWRVTWRCITAYN